MHVSILGLLSNIGSILVAVVVLGVLILVHELGHFGAARALGLPVNEFAIGFGPAIWKRRRGETLYSLRALPLGGYCAFFGEDKDEPDERAFNNQAAWRRLLAILAGPVANLLAGLLMTFLLLTAVGQSVVVPVVETVDPGAPAQIAGLLPGDEITAVNGEPMDGDVARIQETIRDNGLEPLDITILRGGEAVALTITPFFDEELGRARVGLVFGSAMRRMGMGEAVRASFIYCGDTVKEMLSFFRGLFFQGEGAADITGPVGTIGVISQHVSEGIPTVLSLAVLISINLGLVNLLPLPALDGGRLVFILIEIIFRRPVPREKEAWVHVGGLVLLFGLIAIFTVRDIARLFGA